MEHDELENFSNQYMNDTFAFLANHKPAYVGELTDVYAPNHTLYAIGRCAGVNWDDKNFCWYVAIEVSDNGELGIMQFDGNEYFFQRHVGFSPVIINGGIK